MAVWRAVITLSHSSLGGVGTNTWHMRTGDLVPTEEAGLNEIMDSLRIFYETLDPLFAGGTTVAFDGEFHRVDTTTGEFIAGDSWTRTQSLGVDPLPPANCQVVSWRAAAGGRSGRGRTFLGPVSRDTLQDNGTPLEATRASVLAAAQALIDANDSFDDGALGIWSRQDNLLRDFVSATVPNEYAVLRSRRD